VTTASLVLGPPSPLLFFVEVLLLLSLGTAALVVVSGADAGGIVRSPTHYFEPFLDRERDLAAGLGWQSSTWLAARTAFALAGLLIGVSTGIPVAVFGGLVAGIFAFPWAVAARAEKRRLRTERAFVAMVREIRDRMLANTAFDQALRDIAESVGGELGHHLAPLVGDRPIAEALVEVERRARSPLASQICTVFILARTRNQAALVRLLTDTVLPAANAALLIQTEGEVTLAQQRTVTYIMLLIEAVSLWYVTTVPSFHDYYASFLGQLTLVAIALLFLGLVWSVGLILKRPQWTRWDLQRLRREFEAAGLA